MGPSVHLWRAFVLFNLRMILAQMRFILRCAITIKSDTFGEFRPRTPPCIDPWIGLAQGQGVQGGVRDHLMRGIYLRCARKSLTSCYLQLEYQR